MFDRELVLETLSQILTAIDRVIRRFEPVISPDYFLENDDGLDRLDSICMALIAIGESLKNVDKTTDSALLKNYPEIPWKQIKGIRDIISHHYFDLDAEIIYDVCQNHMELLKRAIQKIVSDLSKK